MDSIIDTGECEVINARSKVYVKNRTVHKWLGRYDQGGQAGLCSRGSRPHKSPHCLPVQQGGGHSGASPEAAELFADMLFLPPPISNVTLELRRLGLDKLPTMQLQPPVIRCEHNHPGGMVRCEHNNPADMIHLDIRKFGRVDGVGHGITGDRCKHKSGAGWEYLHGCLHDNSRAGCSEILPTGKPPARFAS